TAGVLIKNAEVLEVMERVDTLVVDKTGTLTEGKAAVATIVPASKLTYTDVLQLAASLEQGSEHPLAGAIVRSAGSRNIQLSRSSDFRAIAGKGVIGTVDGKKVALGNRTLLEELKVELPVPLRDQAETLRSDGQTVMFVVMD